MADARKNLTPSAIKYLLALLELCQKDAGARCMDIAEQLRVKKPSVHSMIENLCAAGLTEKKIRHGVPDAGGPGAGRALCGLLFAPARTHAADIGTERRGRAQRGLRRARAAAGRTVADDGTAEPQGMIRRHQNGASHIRIDRRRDLHLHRRGKGGLQKTRQKRTQRNEPPLSAEARSV